MNKICTTCEYEPDWKPSKYYDNAKCKKLPPFIDAWFYKEIDQTVSCCTDGFQDPILVTDCNLWEAKDDS